MDVGRSSDTARFRIARAAVLLVLPAVVVISVVETRRARRAERKIETSAQTLASEATAWARATRGRVHLASGRLDSALASFERGQEDLGRELGRDHPRARAARDWLEDAYRELRPPSVLVRLPSGEAPEGGWPVMLLLHGFGVNKADLAEFADVVAGQGIAAIALDGPNDYGRGRRSWGYDLERTEAYVNGQIASMRSDPRLDLERMHVGGFSQGAIHAIALVVMHPERYGGVIALSPASGALPSRWRPPPPPHALYLVVGERETASIRSSAGTAHALWDSAGQPVRVHVHEGGHHLPDDWRSRLPGAIEWLLGASG